jgi:hypothetical protein
MTAAASVGQGAAAGSDLLGTFAKSSARLSDQRHTLRGGAARFCVGQRVAHKAAGACTVVHVYEPYPAFARRYRVQFDRCAYGPHGVSEVDLQPLQLGLFA